MDKKEGNQSNTGNISNQTLVMLLIISMAITLLGTFVSLNRTGQPAMVFLSGYALQQNTSTAVVNITIDQVVDINFTTWEINWGEGSVTPGAINCTKTTYPGVGDGSPNCTGFDGGGTRLVIENIGNQNVSLNLSFSSVASVFIGGTSPAYEFLWSCNESNSCRNTTGTADCTGAIPDDNLIYNETFPADTWTTINATSTHDYLICPNFDYYEASDSIDVDFLVTVPEDSFSGNLTSTVTATAYVIDCQVLGTC